MRRALLAAPAVLAFLLQSAWAEPGTDGTLETSPGAEPAVELVEISGVIVAIDTATREVTLDLGDGKTMAFVAGPEVQNFLQLAVGDQVEMEHVRALALELRKGSTEDPWRIDDDRTIRAAPGEKPGGSVGHVVRALVEVVAVNPERGSVTVQGPTRTVELRIPDPEQLARIGIGDRIEVTYIEAGALSVRHSAKPQ
jgi:hypothetical protein